MQMVTTPQGVDALIGSPAKPVLLKSTTTLDEGCRTIFAAAPVAVVGTRSGTVLTGGEPGFARAESDTRLSVLLPEAPTPGSGVSMLFLLPGLGETFRCNGVAGRSSGGRLDVTLTEAFVHCARCVLRSKLWRAVPEPASVTAPESGPLSVPGVAGFLATAPFALTTSRDGDDNADTSPRGDGPGLLRVLDGQTVAFAERRGNKRADTLHNLTSCPEVSLLAVVPGRGDVARLGGTAQISVDPALLATMALRDKAPDAAVVVRVEWAELVRSPAVDALWAGPAAPLPDLNAIAAAHLAGRGGRAAKALARGLAGSMSGVTRRALDASYRSALRDEGYE
ncbi:MULTISPECIES: pyridoxamine 5'-phosphate oxidase family protein [Pseudonocardia]|nr:MULTISPECIES: pyridoxamine 5'-phosphate oxidase family protein [Pseudonocardia]